MSRNIASCYADVSKLERKLGWKMSIGIREMMVRNTWNFEGNNVLILKNLDKC